MISKDLLKEAFRKLLTYTYFDKTDMVMRMRVAEFARSLSDLAHEEEVFGDLAAFPGASAYSQWREAQYRS